MDGKFLINRHGKDFVLYAGLLDQAHKEGLKSINTAVVQVPAPDNGMLAICKAEVITERGIYTGIGDASPDNVNRMVANALVRMAETRAKARALRDAINVGMTAEEELGPDSPDVSLSPTPSRVSPAPSSASPAPPVRKAPGYDTLAKGMAKFKLLTGGITYHCPSNMEEEDIPEQLLKMKDLLAQYTNRADPALLHQVQAIQKLRKELGGGSEPDVVLSRDGADMLIQQLKSELATAKKVGVAV